MVATSANLYGAKPPTTAGEVFSVFADAIDFILDAGPTPVGVESTVVDLSTDLPRILRAGALRKEVQAWLRL